MIWPNFDKKKPLKIDFEIFVTGLTGILFDVSIQSEHFEWSYTWYAQSIKMLSLI